MRAQRRAPTHLLRHRRHRAARATERSLRGLRTERDLRRRGWVAAVSCSLGRIRKEERGMLQGLTRLCRRAPAVALVATLSFTIAGAALAAHPKNGKKYKGSTTQPAINGFKPPVSFTVSKDGKTLLHFKWAGVGCFGAGGFGSGDPWKTGFLNHKVGAMKISRTGSFSIKNSKAGFTFFGRTTSTTSTVKGKFTSSKAAKGTITFTQHLSGSGVKSQSCGPVTTTFTATAG